MPFMMPNEQRENTEDQHTSDFHTVGWTNILYQQISDEQFKQYKNM